METIVIQETDQAVRDVLTLALEAEGFSVLTFAECNSDFITTIDRIRPHLIILDFKISGADCIKMCKLIKESFPHLPVLTMSCNSNINNVYNQFGFDGYISKPFDLDLLYQVLRKYIPEVKQKEAGLESKTFH